MIQSTTVKPFVFVIMPFAKEFDDIYQFGIKEACQLAGAYCERVDEQLFTESILERVYNQISKADLIIADMSDRNPNVFYEVGYSHALGKQVVHLTKRSEDIPFDMRHFPHIIYGNSISTLKEQLTKRVEWFVKNPKNLLKDMEFYPEFYINGTKIEDGAICKIRTPSVLSLDSQYRTYKIVDIRVDIYNPSPRSYTLNNVMLALVFGNWEADRQVAEILHVEPDIAGPDVVLPTGENMYMIPLSTTLFPDSWRSIVYERILFNPPQKCLFRIFSEIGSTDLTFTLTNQWE